MAIFSKFYAVAVLTVAFGMQAGAAQAQCSPTNPACQAPPTQSGGGGSGGGGSVGVKVDIGDAAKAIGGIFKKKKKKPVEQPTEAVAAPVEQPKQEVVFVKSPPVIQALPKTTRKTPTKTAVVARPKPQPVTRKIAAPIVAAAAVAEPVVAQEVVAEVPLPEPEPVAEMVQPDVPVSKAEAITPSDDAPKPANSLYWIIAAVVAALVAAGTAAKFFLTPKVAMNCSIADGTSHMVSNPSLSKPEVSFDVIIPGFSASTPENFRILA